MVQALALRGDEKVLEIRTGCFERRVALPPGLDTESVEIRFEYGVLEVRIPRSGP